MQQVGIQTPPTTGDELDLSTSGPQRRDVMGWARLGFASKGPPRSYAPLDADRNVVIQQRKPRRLLDAHMNTATRSASSKLETRASPRAVAVRQMLVDCTELDLRPGCRSSARLGDICVPGGRVLRRSGLRGGRRSRGQDRRDREDQRSETSHGHTPARCCIRATSSSGRNGLVT